MTREEAIKNITTYLYAEFENVPKKVIESLEMAIADMEKQIQWKKTDKYNRMIEAFECDFSLIEQGCGMFAELDKKMKDKRYALAEDMDLMQELSYLLRHGQAEIYVRGEENDDVYR